MPSATNLVVKKNDGTTDVTYTLIAASGGDKAPAIFRQEAASAIPAARPIFRVEAAPNAAKTARVVVDRLEYPYSLTDSVNGRITVVNKVIVEKRVILPADVPDTIYQEAVAQHANLSKHTVVLQSEQSGYAPT